jgi:hypothetical protein
VFSNDAEPTDSQPRAHRPRALFAGRRNVVAGWSNVFAMFLMRFLPRRAMTRAAALFMSAPPPLALPAAEGVAAGSRSLLA